MANQEGAARPAREGVGVSSGESSAPTPRPALDSDAATLPGVSVPQSSGLPPETVVDQNAFAGEAAETVIAPIAPVKVRPPEPVSMSHPIFASIGATIFNVGDVLG